MNRLKAVAVLGFVLMTVNVTAATTRKSAPPKAAPKEVRAVGPRDFFLYSCVREYAKAHSFPLYDSSSGYAVEYSTMGPEELSRLHDAAHAFALTLRTPDLHDEEHGGVAVVALCLEESRSSRVGALLATPKHK